MFEQTPKMPEIKFSSLGFVINYSEIDQWATNNVGIWSAVKSNSTIKTLETLAVVLLKELLDSQKREAKANLMSPRIMIVTQNVFDKMQESTNK